MMFDPDEPIDGVIVAGRTAVHFIRQFGEGAQFEIARRAFHCRNHGDKATSDAWIAVLAEAVEFQRIRRRRTERLH